MKAFKEPKMFGAVTVGERGQVVIPAKVRKLYKIASGDTLIVFAKQGGPIGLVPADEFTSFLERAAAMLAKVKQKKFE